MPSKREQLLEIMEGAAKGETKATLRARIAELEAENVTLRRHLEDLSRTGAVKVKPLDEDDYEEIISEAAINLREATSGIRGQVVMVQDSLDWWVMKETERRILSALEAQLENQRRRATNGR